MQVLLLLLCLAIDGWSFKDDNVVRFDIVELNHRYDDTGRHCYDQLIFWDFDPRYNRYSVEAWALTDGTKYPMQDSKGWRVMLVDANREPFVVKAGVFRQSWTTTDPERDDRKLKDDRYRRGFGREHRK